MKVNELRIGNLIKVHPRENQEGLLALKEIQQETIIGEMISPRPGYQFRLEFDEIVFIPVNEEWLSKLGFKKDPGQPEYWRDSRGLYDFCFSEEGKNFFINKDLIIGKRPVENVHDLQNGYFFLTGEEITTTIDLERQEP
jgi:hypothetical protein